MVTGSWHESMRSTSARQSLRSGVASVETQLAHDELVEPLVVHEQRHLVDVVGVGGRDHGLRLDVAEQRDLVADVPRERFLGAGHDDVGLDADLAQLGDAVLGRLGLGFADDADHRHQRDVDVEHVVAADVFAELADGFEERQAFDVADGAADLGDEHVDVELLARRCTRLLISLVM